MGTLGVNQGCPCPGLAEECCSVRVRKDLNPIAELTEEAVSEVEDWRESKQHPREGRVGETLIADR